MAASPSQALAAGTTQPAEFDPTSAYEPRDVRGWQVLVNRKLLAEPALAADVLAEVDHQLYQVVRRVPAGPVAKLRKVRVWAELTDRDVRGACYHPSAEWLRGHGFNPDKARGVELGNARNLVSWSLHQPYMVLHELAHAYHHQVLGYDYPAIKAAYKNAVESKRYEEVLNHLGKHVRHYALNNDQEYFAEGTEAFFGTNDFYPFVRAELKEHDPQLHKVMMEVWEMSDQK